MDWCKLTEDNGEVVVTVDHSEQRVTGHVTHRVAHVLLEDPVEHVILLEPIAWKRQKSEKPAPQLLFFYEWID